MTLYSGCWASTRDYWPSWADGCENMLDYFLAVIAK